MNIISTATGISDDKKTATFSIILGDDKNSIPVAYGVVELATGRVLSLLIGRKEEVV